MKNRKHGLLYGFEFVELARWNLRALCNTDKTVETSYVKSVEFLLTKSFGFRNGLMIHAFLEKPKHEL